jgi:uncharacterized protein YggE
MTERVMRVQGNAEASAPADRVVLGFDVNAWNREYGSAVDALNMRVDDLRTDLGALSVAREHLKTANFRVNPTYETVNRLGREQRQLSGYMASHSIRLELPMNQDQLNRILQAVGEGESEPSISIGFEVEDTAGLRQQALENAVAEAQRNAETLAAAAGVALKQIVSIEYGWAEVRIQAQHMLLAQPRGAGPVTAPDIEPEDVEVSEKVTITWEIE